LLTHKRTLPVGVEHWRATCLNYACFCSCALGFPDKALRQALEFVAWAREQGQLVSLAMGLNCLASVLIWRGEAIEALKYADTLLGITAEHGFSHWHSLGQLNHAQALTLVGNTNEAIAQTRTALESLVVTGAVVPSWAYAGLISAYLTAEQAEEGLKISAKALETAAETGDAEAKSELQRLHGELLLLIDATKIEEAEAFLRAAIVTARKQSAKFPELRATLSLARLLTQQGRRDEARARVAEICGWFNEGFDTADLKDAKALLDELSH